MREGLSESTSVGRWGSFGDARKVSCGLNTCVVYGLSIFTFGPNSRPIGAPATGGDVSIKTVSIGWTGKTIELRAGGKLQRIDLRCSLPGPMFTPAGRRWGFEWVVKSSPLEIVSLPDGKTLKAWSRIESPPQVMLARGRSSAVLVVTSMQAKSLEITTHEHWQMEFGCPGAHIMLVPLLDEADAPRSEQAARLWVNLIEAPPVACRDDFEIDDDVLTIRSEFSGPDGGPVKVSPLPPTAALCGGSRGLQQLPAHNAMLTTPMGPYAVTSGSSYQRSIKLDWVKAAVKPSREVTGRLSQIPAELTYAGDVSWDESTPMDALLCCRQWAPLAGICPPGLWQEIRSRFDLPSADAFAASLASYIEPANGRKWCRDAELFGHCGQTSYDTDWYNGLTLSGLHRAGVCADESLAAAARELAGQIRSQRADMLAYFEIYNDWALGAPWTDPRGAVWDLDCSHNGLEGVLAEACLRKMEGDHAGSELALYLAGRMAISFLAAMDIGRLCYRLGVYVHRLGNEPQDERDVYYTRTFRETEGAVCVTPASSCPVVPAPDFPEYCALLRKYGPMDRIEELAARYIAENPARYEDWLSFYLGPDVAEGTRAGAEEPGFHQERRAQSAVFYHVAHDTSLRLWVLGQNGDEVESLHRIPMPLSSQLWCRADAKLETP